MKVGIDSYSYHRRYGEIRPGEVAPSQDPWRLEPTLVLEHARDLAADVLMLETCYLPAPSAVDRQQLREASPLTVGFSWGHPWPNGAFHGLEGGRSRAAEADLAAWIELAADLGHEVMRITAGSPASRGDEPAGVLIDRLTEPLCRAATAAAGHGLSLAIENHGDLTASQLREAIERADRPNLGVTLDTVNLIRLGDDMVEGTRILADLTLVVQLKDHLATDDPDMPGGPVCTALGEGVAPLGAVIEVLDEAGFDGAVCVELASLGSEDVDELALMESSVAWLREHLPSTVG